MNIWLSEIDRERFGVTIAKLNAAATDDPAKVEQWCNDNRVEMLIIRCPSEQLKTVQQFERHGAQLMDTLVYYHQRNITARAIALPPCYTTRLATAEDAVEIEGLAIKAFSAFSGHYHADTRLGRDDCNMVYGSWAANSCLSKKVADDVLLISCNEVIAGFLTLKYHTSHSAEIVLNAVDPQHQGAGLYTALVGLALNRSVERGIDSLVVSTQLTNLGPQKVWCRHGFEPQSSFYTLHKWF